MATIKVDHSHVSFLDSSKQLLYLACADGKIRIVNLKEGNSIKVLSAKSQQYSMSFTGISLSLDGDMMLTSNDDGEVTLYKGYPSHQTLNILKKFAVNAMCCGFSRTHQCAHMAGCGSADGKILVFEDVSTISDDNETKLKCREIKPETDTSGVCQMEWFRNSNILAIATCDGAFLRIRIVCGETHQILTCWLHQFPKFTNQPHCKYRRMFCMNEDLCALVYTSSNSIDIYGHVSTASEWKEVMF